MPAGFPDVTGKRVAVPLGQRGRHGKGRGELAFDPEPGVGPDGWRIGINQERRLAAVRALKPDPGVEVHAVFGG